MVVVERYPRSAEVARRLLVMAEAKNISCPMAGANKVEDESDLEFIREYLGGGPDMVTPKDGAVVGYHEDLTCDPIGNGCADVSDNSSDERTGSHMLVTGIDHTYTGFGGLLAGADNTTTNDWASVAGRFRNTASGRFASVSGGSRNTASGVRAWVSGGDSNIASGRRASVSGGEGNTAEGWGASVSGGTGNTAADRRTMVAGGRDGEIADDGSLQPGGNVYDSLIGNQRFDDQ